MEPAQNEVQDDQISPTEVPQDDRSDQTDRAMYRIDPRTFGKELRLEPRPEDRTDRTGGRLPRPTHQAKTDGRARINSNERSPIQTEASLFWPVWLVREERPADRTDRPVFVHLLTAGHASGYIEPKQEYPKGLIDQSSSISVP
ncbi:hypothetical protein F2Q69_00027914 [Brassica cretica]|uniref:Uncharacterized protein n=1 Tax=Brassica cretica TaxID=69181 RepID=A0A8S9RZE1_BRACR|nr:hypothetical protein F2Q69_00027914 [Brassica cretica]